MRLRWETCWDVPDRFSHNIDTALSVHEWAHILYAPRKCICMYFFQSIFVHFTVCAVVHAKCVCALISLAPPAKSVAELGYGPLVLILAQMIDSPGGETTGSALWRAVNMLRVTLCHQERKRRGKKAMKVTGE